MLLRKSFSIGIIAIAIIFVFSKLSLAGIVVTPERHVLELSPGEEKTVDYKINNAGQEDIHIKVEPKEWAKASENKDIDINSWLFIENTDIDFKTGETKALNIKVKAPEKAKGEIVAMIFLCYKEQKESSLNLRYGNPLYLIIKGTERYDAKINKIDCIYFKDPKRDNRTCLQIPVNITNSGNVHIKPDIKINILDKGNNAVNELKIADGNLIFPGQNYTYALEWWDAQLSDGLYTAKINIGYQEKMKLPEQMVKFEIKKDALKIIK